MIRLLSFAGALALACAPASGADLFNGRDFSGWELVAAPAAPIAASFSMLPGGVVASTGAPTGFLATTASYRNYRLHVEWRWSAKPGNGGVLLHISPGPFDRAWPLSLQVQTKHGSAGDLLPMAGARFSEALTAGAAVASKARLGPDSERPAGEWNSCDIVSRDGTIEVTVNGVPQNRISAAQPAAGRIGFQLEGAPYELRSVVLSELE
jgi:hypothetical protein